MIKIKLRKKTSAQGYGTNSDKMITNQKDADQRTFPTNAGPIIELTLSTAYIRRQAKS